MFHLMSKKVKFFGFSPVVHDGSTINVGMKEEVEKINFTEYATNLTTIYSDLMQAYLLVSVIAQQK